MVEGLGCVGFRAPINEPGAVAMFASPEARSSYG